MGKYKITDPETKRVLFVTGDSPPTEEEMHELFSHGDTSRDAEPITDYSRAAIAEGSKLSGKELNQARAAEALQGTTFNFGDELIGGMSGINSLVRGDGFDKGYRSGAEKVRGRLHQYETERPLEALGVNAAGMIPGLVTGAGLAGAVSRSGKALSLGSRVGRAAGVGALYGGAAGAGAADDTLSDRVKGAAEGATVGTILGSAFPVIPTAARAVRNATEKMFLSPQEFAGRAVARALEEDAVPQTEVAARLGQQGKTLLDVAGPSTTAVAEQGALEGRGRVVASKFFEGEDKSREGKVLDRVRNLVSDQPMYEKIDELNTKRMSDARPLYLDAYAAPYRRTPKLADLAGRSWVAGAARTAMTRLKNDPDIDPAEVQKAMGPIFGNDLEGLSDAQITQRLTQALGQRPIEFKVLDYIKRGLDAMAESPDASKEVRKLRNAWREELKAINPKYQKALSAWAGPSATLDAIEAGRTFDKMDPEAIQRMMGTFGDAEQEAFQVGVSRRLQDLSSGGGLRPGSKASLSLADGIANNSVMQKRLRAALGSTGVDADTLLGRNGWKPVADGTFENVSQPGTQITVGKDGTWRLYQSSKTGKSVTMKAAGPDQSTLEAHITGNAPVVKRGPTSVDDLITLSQELTDRANKRTTIMGNSATVRRQEGSKAFNQLGDTVDQVNQVAQAAKKGGLTGMVGHAMSVSSDYLLKGLTSKRREAISQLMYSDDPADKQKAVEIIERLRKGKAVPEALYRPGISTPALSQATGTSVGGNK